MIKYTITLLKFCVTGKRYRDVDSVVIAERIELVICMKILHFRGVYLIFPRRLLALSLESAG